MQDVYLLQKEFITESDEREWGYPDYVNVYPVAVFNSEKAAEKFVSVYKQCAADRFMDWLDIFREYYGEYPTDVKLYYDHEPDNYLIRKVPYFNND